ncbi:VCBS repeat-containing protein [Pseudohalocynthiibacter sp. F2068]|jgi:FG-GAP-like repeat|uniref:FG-GAP repeat domain-containing protein n=1 Tax=Pseudohalocynthiibacter sp. F2068 TaxID=2926418 RepID=UPI001FF4C260|nr:VCBS repeat-containing protein [Pseudohalocynthiibacter sp. F2068]MCK0103427.1 VCBS repeat-containing protein [Pseudohalocynthiibacter sp. F2068]
MLRAGLLGLSVLCAAQVSAAEIISARYAEPTTRYGHGILGDAIEHGALRLRLADGQRVIIRLPDTHVFEDTAPRLADVDNDGTPEVIVVETDVARGASLAIYDETGKVAETRHIGRPNRWLAPVGAADLDGDGYVEIAYVDRPHLAKLLKIWRFRDGKLEQVAEISGLTNHQIGQREISGGVASCPDEPVLVTANANWTKVMATSFRNGAYVSVPVADFSGPTSFENAAVCSK